jgi:GT2 family glycosyltransferase
VALEDLPLVSIITPSFNQGQFIRQTIESVLQQDYPHLEHIVVDGGSTDDTLAILEHYSQLDTRFRFVAEPDRGQSHAINKGLALARGEIIGWLNSDDTYEAGAVMKAVKALQQHPDWGMVHGNAYVTNESNQKVAVFPFPPQLPVGARELFECCHICQPSAFIRKDVWEEVGGVDEKLNFCMDYDLWIRIAKTHRIGTIEDCLANARYHGSSKSGTQWASVGIPEVLQTSLKHFGAISNTWFADHYVPHYRKHGIYRMLHDVKTYKMFGNTPELTDLNRFPDRMVPLQFVLSIKVDPEHPLDTLLLKGQIPANVSAQQQGIHQLTVLLNGQLAGNVRIPARLFDLEIPLRSNKTENRVDIFSSWHVIVPDSQTNKRVCSFLAQEVIPLSREEAEFYRVFMKDQPRLKEWIRENRRPVPRI